MTICHESAWSIACTTLGPTSRLRRVPVGSVGDRRNADVRFEFTRRLPCAGLLHPSASRALVCPGRRVCRSGTVTSRMDRLSGRGAGEGGGAVVVSIGDDGEDGLLRGGFATGALPHPVVALEQSHLHACGVLPVGLGNADIADAARVVSRPADHAMGQERAQAMTPPRRSRTLLPSWRGGGAPPLLPPRAHRLQRHMQEGGVGLVAVRSAMAKVFKPIRMRVAPLVLVERIRMRSWPSTRECRVVGENAGEC